MKGFNKKTLADIIEWDKVNWTKALKYWEEHVPSLKTQHFDCLELGGRRGGLSLWLALLGHNVICSDFKNPEQEAKTLHDQYNLDGKISYEAIDATKIPYENKFDIIVFKSIIGGISGHGKDHLKEKVFQEIHKALKPGGKLLFAENMEGSKFHLWARNKFVNWGERWNYFKYSEIDLIKIFESVEYETTGFTATFGRNDKQREALGNIDQLLEPLIPPENRYILYGVATKSQ